MNLISKLAKLELIIFFIMYGLVCLPANAFDHSFDNSPHQTKTEIKRAEFIGNEGAYGGDDIPLDFKNSAFKAIKNIRNNLYSDLIVLNKLDLWSTVVNVKVFTTDQDLYVDTGHSLQSSVALTFPAKNAIYVNSKRWSAISLAKEKEALALHEILILFGLETTGVYTYSQIYLEQLSNCDYNICLKLIKLTCEITNDDFKKNGVSPIIQSQSKRDLYDGLLNMQFDLSNHSSGLNVDVYFVDGGSTKSILINVIKNNSLLSVSEINNVREMPKNIVHSWHTNDLNLRSRWQINCTFNAD